MIHAYILMSTNDMMLHRAIFLLSDIRSPVTTSPSKHGPQTSAPTFYGGLLEM